jgi:hypothetical protein
MGTRSQAGTVVGTTPDDNGAFRAGTVSCWSDLDLCLRCLPGEEWLHLGRPGWATSSERVARGVVDDPGMQRSRGAVPALTGYAA